MDTRFIRGSVAGALLVAASLVLPSESSAQRSGVEIWEASCGRCHLIQPTDKFGAADWRSVGMHMAITARLTSAQRDAVIAFLISGARRVETAQATQPPSAAPVATVEAAEAVGCPRNPRRHGDAAGARRTDVSTCRLSRASDVQRHEPR